jgi:NlpC/P60 family
VTTPADMAISYARQQIGKPYRYGFTGPNYFDCSGLVQSAYKYAGILLPRTSEIQMTVGTPVTRNALEPGDLVFPDSGHVQIYVGDGEIIEAPRTGLLVRQVPIWGFLTARRITSPGSSIKDTVTTPQKSNATSSFGTLISPFTAIAGAQASAVQGALQQALNAIPGFSQIEALGTGIQKLSDVTLWKRIGTGALGIVMILMGTAVLARKPLVRAGAAVATEGASEGVRAVKSTNNVPKGSAPQ